MKNLYCTIMAGGTGTRFWPRSKSSRPKQYLNLFGDKSLLQSTIGRFEGMTEKENIFIVSNQSQTQILESQTLGIPLQNHIYEPVGKNTLPCIGLAAMIAENQDPEGIMVVSPSDHMIGDTDSFQETVMSAVAIASTSDGIVTIGIRPEYAATGYGYVQVGKELPGSNEIRSFRVERFVEKPDLATADNYLKQGGFFWNSGMFIFKIRVFLETVRELKPDIYAGLRKIQTATGTPEFPDILDANYREMENISIDFGIMEHAKNLYLVEGDFSWNDLGSWESVYKAGKKDENGNVSSGETLLVDTTNSYIYADAGLISVLGLDEVIVVKEGDSILVCHRDKAEEVKKMVEILKNKNNYHYL